MLNLVFIDSESTGTTVNDRIIQFSAIDGKGNILANSLYRPEIYEQWYDTICLHGIWPSHVAGRPLFKEDAERCGRLLADADAVVGWSIGNDLRMMRLSGMALPRNAVYIDIMPAYSRMVCNAQRGGTFQAQSLASAVQHYKVKTRGAHDALNDAFATRGVFFKMLRDDSFSPAFGPFFAWLVRSGGNCMNRRKKKTKPSRSPRSHPKQKRRPQL